MGRQGIIEANRKVAHIVPESKAEKSHREGDGEGVRYPDDESLQQSSCGGLRSDEPLRRPVTVFTLAQWGHM